MLLLSALFPGIERIGGGWVLRSGPAGTWLRLGNRNSLANPTSPDQAELWSGEAR
jgi:hypothetical protein